MMSHQKKGIHPRPCGIINLSNIISYGRGTLPYLIEKKEGEKYFDVKIPDADSPSLSEGQKKLAEIAEKFGLEGFGNIVVDDDGRLKIQAEFENFDADLHLSRMEEQSYLHCWDRLPSEFPEK